MNRLQRRPFPCQKTGFEHLSHGSTGFAADRYLQRNNRIREIQDIDHPVRVLFKMLGTT